MIKLPIFDITDTFQISSQDFRWEKQKRVFRNVLGANLEGVSDYKDSILQCSITANGYILTEKRSRSQSTCAKCCSQKRFANDFLNRVCVLLYRNNINKTNKVSRKTDLIKTKGFLSPQMRVFE